MVAIVTVVVRLAPPPAAYFQEALEAVQIGVRKPGPPLGRRHGHECLIGAAPVTPTEGVTHTSLALDADPILEAVSSAEASPRGASTAIGAPGVGRRVASSARACRLPRELSNIITATIPGHRRVGEVRNRRRGNLSSTER